MKDRSYFHWTLFYAEKHIKSYIEKKLWNRVIQNHKPIVNMYTHEMPFLLKCLERGIFSPHEIRLAMKEMEKESKSFHDDVYYCDIINLSNKMNHKPRQILEEDLLLLLECHNIN